MTSDNNQKAFDADKAEAFSEKAAVCPLTISWDSTPWWQKIAGSRYFHRSSPMWGEEKAREYLEKAAFKSIETNQLAHDIQNNWYVVRKWGAEFSIAQQ